MYGKKSKGKLTAKQKTLPKGLQRPEEDIREEFLTGLRLMFPDLMDSDIVSARVHRAGKVQPLQVLNFSDHIPKSVTSHADFFVHNTAQFVNNTLNNNEVIRAVNAFLDEHEGSLEMFQDTKSAANVS